MERKPVSKKALQCGSVCDRKKRQTFMHWLVSSTPFPSFLSLFFILIFFSMADANPLQFSDPKSVPETALFSFHPLFYLYFILSFLLVPYLLYRWIASKYKWELNSKSVGRHCSDLLLGMSYGLILFTFGNYTHTYRFIRA